MHSVDTFIQTDLPGIKGIFISSCIPWESNPWPCWRVHTYK